MTPEQEAALIKSNETLAAQIAALAPAMTEMKTQLTTISAENAELKKGVQISAQEVAIRDLKTKYPNVPETTLRALPEAVRDAEAKTLNDQFSKLAANPVTDPNAWADIGGMGGSLEAEAEAERKARDEARVKARDNGDVMGVLRASSREILNFIKPILATPK